MSITAVAWALNLHVGSPTLKFVLIAVANYADEEGVCWPSQERLARDTELSDRAVREALKQLEIRGFLTRTHRQINGSKRQSDMIQLVYQRKDVPLVHPEGASGGPPERRSKNHRNVVPKPPERGSGKNLQQNHQEEPSKEEERAEALFPPEAFVEFWDLYPNKVGRRKAEAAFDLVRKKKRTTFEILMSGLRTYVAKTDDRPWCNPATWLNQDRWDDLPANVVRLPVNGRDQGNGKRSVQEVARDYESWTAGLSQFDA